MIMTNLFSIFDPSLSLFSFSWLFVIFSIFIFSSFYWIYRLLFFFLFSFLLLLKKEISYVLHFSFKGCYIFIGSIFLIIRVYNFLALFPYLFSLTSHLLVTFPLSYSFWLGVIFFSLFSSLKHFFSHLIPQGTPFALISFMVVVELLSNFIRPIALTFRLTANIIAGHLLISLVGRFLINSGIGILVMGSLLQCLLVFIELGVSLIQAYVFSTLILLYISEGQI